MKHWLRTASLHIKGKSPQDEIWTFEDTDSGSHLEYPLAVYLGKPIDIMSLKIDVLEDLRGNISHVRESRTELFSQPDLEPVGDCPVCESGENDFILEVYAARYHECAECGHFFVSERPGKKALDEFYSRDEEIASTYTDRRTSETRVQQVALPKAKWMVEVFKNRYGREPKKILDVGAGGGHFVKACRDLGLDAQGIELSDSSRKHCRDCFGFDLRALDWLEVSEETLEADVVTFWGVIEHVPRPVAFLEKAREVLSERQSFVIAEVPRWDCLGTAIQKEYSDSLVRHLNPMGHINIFSDSSLATAFATAGLAPTAAWYFGMDAYELATQLAYKLDDEEIFEKLRPLIGSLQEFCDLHRFSDEMVLAGVPK